MGEDEVKADAAAAMAKLMLPQDPEADAQMLDNETKA